MKTVVAAVAAVFFLAAFTAPLKPTNNAGPKQVMYEIDGHYWSVRLMAYLVSNDTSYARQLAYWAEWPDQVTDAGGNPVKGRNTWLLPWRQALWHALTGRKADKTRSISMNRVRNAKDVKQKGINLHRLGDSFAHAMKKDKRMFPLFIGHALKGHFPDKIANFPDKYLIYVDSLALALGGDPQKIDLTAFKYIAGKGLDSQSNAEVLKTELNLKTLNNKFVFLGQFKKTIEEYLNMRGKELKFTYEIMIDGHPSRENKPPQYFVTITYN